MAIRFACPKCRTAYTVNDRDAGKKSECKACGQRIEVPAPPPRAKTVLGEILPPNDSPSPAPMPSPAAAPPPSRPRPSQSVAPPGRTSAATSAAGPIRFDCPGCRTSMTVNRRSAGKVIECRSCGRWLTVPGEPDQPQPAPEPEPRREPAPQPDRWDDREPDYPPPREERWSDRAEDDYGPAEPLPPMYTPGLSLPGARRPNGPINRTLAGIGSGIILIALFLPMVTAPLGIWLSFIDVPWKAVTVGSAVMDEVAAERRAELEQPRRRAPAPARAERDAPDRPAAAGLVVLVGIGSVVFPLLVLVVLALTAYQIVSARSAGGYMVGGLLIGLATAMYAMGLLLLNTIAELRPVLVLVSPGFGWAVLVVGVAALAAAGLIRLDPRPAY